MATKKKEVEKEIKEKVCVFCEGTGRGVSNGFNVTTCPICLGTGK